jgi:zinc transport system ATP-binding protein
MKPPSPVIEFDDVSFSYDGAPVLEHVDLAIRANEFVCLVGPNGGGKSTLLKLALGLLTPRAGRVRLLAATPAESRGRVGYMPQHAQLDPQFPVTVMDVVLMGRLTSGLRPGPFARVDRQVAAEALREVELYEFRGRVFSSLSGGQRQRVLIARALACEPEVLMLDEPTASLDLHVEERLYELLRELSRRMTVVIVSHDVGFVSQYVQRVICVNRTVETHATGEVTGGVIAELYGRDVRMIHHGHRHE